MTMAHLRHLEIGIDATDGVSLKNIYWLEVPNDVRANDVVIHCN